MKKIITFAAITSLACSLYACNTKTTEAQTDKASSTTALGGQSAVKDDESQKDVVKVAAGSAEHTTLVAAVKQAELVDALSNAGPFTVFAPTNAAFDKLPKGTVEGLMKEDKKADLQDVLQYHVYVGIIKPEMMQDGMTLNQVNGGNISISSKDGKIVINNSATILASIPASNGMIHVIDGVLLPPAK
jgi:uncharacterized surface protein with fasciclin (FAS1) repeats